MQDLCCLGMLPGYQVFVESWRCLLEFSGHKGWGKKKKIANRAMICKWPCASHPCLAKDHALLQVPCADQLRSICKQAHAFHHTCDDIIWAMVGFMQHPMSECIHQRAAKCTLMQGSGDSAGLQWLCSAWDIQPHCCSSPCAQAATKVVQVQVAIDNCKIPLVCPNWRPDAQCRSNAAYMRHLVSLVTASQEFTQFAIGDKPASDSTELKNQTLIETIQPK